MLETIKSYIQGLSDIPFPEFYQNYICYVQDQNIWVEVNSIKTDEILTLTKLIERLR
jgi:hypothetical protein